LKVAVLTTSYPRWDGDPAGAFVADVVRAAREAGVEVEVVSPAGFPHFGLAYGHGIAGNLRAAPWKAVLLPAFLVSFALAARRASRSADVVHAHWLFSGLAGLAAGRPLIVQPWGSDVALAPWLARVVLPRAQVVVAASEFLAEAARRLGARDVRVVPVAPPLPSAVGEPADPPHVLFAGRLSTEKGILEFVQATEGLPRVIVGDGPLWRRVPETIGSVPRDRLGAFYERAAVVCVPSRREGYGMVAREAMAYGRPVVATAVGGLLDAVADGETGLLVPPGDVDALRAAVMQLLEHRDLAARLGQAARGRAREMHKASQSALGELYSLVSSA
jgi:glycosyltransferase involved in cell wall biosynthesis